MRGKYRTKNLSIVGLTITRPPMLNGSSTLGTPLYVPGPSTYVKLEYNREGAKCIEEGIRVIGEVRGICDNEGRMNMWKFKGVAADLKTYLYNLKMAVN